MKMVFKISALVFFVLIIGCDFSAKEWLDSEKQYRDIDDRAVEFLELIGTYAVKDTAIRRQFGIKKNQELYIYIYPDSSYLLKNVIVNKIKNGKSEWCYRDTLIQNKKLKNLSTKDTIYDKIRNYGWFNNKGIDNMNNSSFNFYVKEQKLDPTICLEFQYLTYPHDASKTRWLYYCKISDTPVPKPKE